MTVRAVVPLKPLRNAKSRLSAVLSPAERRALALDMAEHVVGVLLQVVDEVFLLGSTALPAYPELPCLKDSGGGLNRALDRAIDALPHTSGDILLVVAGDLPLLGVLDVKALVAAAEAGVALAPDRARTGTNALGLRSPRDFRFRFGSRSCEAHTAEAARVGASCEVIARSGLALDVDDADSLEAFRTLRLPTSPV